MLIVISKTKSWIDVMWKNTAFWPEFFSNVFIVREIFYFFWLLNLKISLQERPTHWKLWDSNNLLLFTFFKTSNLCQGTLKITIALRNLNWKQSYGIRKTVPVTASWFFITCLLIFYTACFMIFVSHFSFVYFVFKSVSKQSCLLLEFF